MSTVLAAVDVSRWYRRGSETVRAVDEVSLTLDAGRIYVLQGPSGSGKTTLLNVLAGWERPDAGRVQWQGETTDPATLSWTQLAVVPQRVGLLPELTALENVTLAARIGGRPEPEVGALLAAIGLEDLEDAFPDELSAGQQQRVAVARAIVDKPRVVLVDEPTSSQDEDSARAVLGAMRRLTDERSTCLIASHDPIALEFADSVIQMRDGRIV